MLKFLAADRPTVGRHVPDPAAAFQPRMDGHGDGPSHGGLRGKPIMIGPRREVRVGQLERFEVPKLQGSLQMLRTGIRQARTST